ncbi:hypothetical protein EIN_386360, partial [Entamoeba invadens IP1]
MNYSVMLITIFALLYVLNVPTTYILSLINHRSSLYTLLSLLLPFVTPLFVFLIGSPRLPDSQEYVPFVDVCWYRMSNKKSPMVITSSVGGSTKVDWPVVIPKMYESLKQHERMTRRVTKSNGYYVFEDCEMDIDYHMNFCDAELSKEEYVKKINELKGLDLDENRPLWKIIIFPNVENSWRMVVKISHCLVDGLTAVRLMQEVAEASNLELNDYNESKYHFLEINKEIAKLAALTLSKQPKGIWTRVKRISLIPIYMLRVFFAKNDTVKCLRKKLSGKQQCFWGKMSSVDSVKEVAKQFGGNLNTLLFSCMADTFSEVVKEKGGDETEVNFYVAANLRMYEPKIQFGNKIGLLLMSLPLDNKNLKTRFETIKGRLETAKNSMEAYVYYVVQSVIGIFPDWIQALGIKIVERKATLNVTTVPGFKEPLNFFGSKVDDVM